MHVSTAKVWRPCLIFLLVALGCTSLMMGAQWFTPTDLLGVRGDYFSTLFIESRLPRTLAAALSGSSLAVAGLLMQMLVRNRFAEPATTGSMEGATLGFIVAALCCPDAALSMKVGIAVIAAGLSCLTFITMVSRLPATARYMASLVGLVLSGILYSVATAVAIDNNLMQSVGAWSLGDFSAVIRGRYEWLWAGALCTVAMFMLAPHFTISGLGKDISTGLGLNHALVMTIGIILVSIISATVIVTVGNLPFIGLVIPNIVRTLVGDNVKTCLPWVATGGAVLVLACDVLSRSLIYPHEVPAGTVVGVVGCLALLMIIRGRS